MDSEDSKVFKMDVENDNNPQRPKKFKDWRTRSPMSFFRQAWKMGKDDPRKIIHALKVGFALCVVSPFYLTDPLFNGVAGASAIWAVITVVVVFEFSVGATLCKGLNRGLGTLLAGFLALVVDLVAKNAGNTGQAVLIGIAIFIFGAAVTYFRFVPSVKSKFDYGMVIFLITFNMIAISAYRSDNIATVAYERLITILIGCGICLLVSLIIFPVWAGEDLHQMLLANLQCLIASFQGCVHKYFEDGLMISSSDEEGVSEETLEDPIYQGYRAILDSKVTEETLANCARWEPRHGRFRFRYPWTQYLKIGITIRHCAYSVVALHGCLRSEIQTPPPVRAVLRRQCMKISTETVKVLEELAESVMDMRRCGALEPMMKRIDIAVQELHSVLRAEPELFIDSNRWSIVEEIPEKDESPEEELTLEDQTSPNNETEAQESQAGDELINHRKTRAVAGSSDLRISYSMDSAGQYKSSQGNPSAQRCSRLVSWHGPETIPTTPRGENAVPGLGRHYSSRKFNGSNQLQFAEAFPLGTFASLMVEFTARLKHLAVGVDELGKLARFKEATEEGTNRRGVSYTRSKDFVSSHVCTHSAE